LSFSNFRKMPEMSPDELIRIRPADATVFETANLWLGSCWAFASRAALSEQVERRQRGQQGDEPDDAGLVARIAGGEHGGEEGVGEKSGAHDDDEAEQPHALPAFDEAEQPRALAAVATLSVIMLRKRGTPLRTLQLHP
jgi:hypothetical protein